MKKIGILGSGIVAQALGAGFIKNGYQTMLGSRDPLKLADWQKGAGAGASTGSFAEAARFGEILILAVKGTVATQVLLQAGPENLAGKTIIDATNPIADAPPTNGVLKFFTQSDQSLMEILQEAVPAANFVKAFNSVGNVFMVDPAFNSKPTMFICGNSEKAKQETSVIIDKFGWEPADFGMAESARAIESLCILWCIPGLMKNEWMHAFKLLRL